MSTVVIPVEVLDLVRDGLRGQISLAGAHVASADEQPEGRSFPERYRDPLRCQDALRALLGEIGWSGSPSDIEIDSPSDLKVDLDKHGWALLEALQDQISDHADRLRDIDRDEDRDEQRRDLVMRDMNALSTLALIVLLRMQARVLRPAAGAARRWGSSPRRHSRSMPPPGVEPGSTA
jgi:hypothetical protein